ncbi:hypothetical protein Tco_0616569 [Tanacetum coccineum]
MADDSSRNNHGHQQQPFKRQNVAKVYNIGTGEKKPYGGSRTKLQELLINTNDANTQKVQCGASSQGKWLGLMQLECREEGNASGENPDANVVTAQEYMAKGCQIFLVQISAKKEDDKSEGKQIKDVPIV